MAETSHDIRRELEVTREHVGDTLAALERKVNPRYLLAEHPLVALGVAFGAGVLLGSVGGDGRGGHRERVVAGTARTSRSSVRPSLSLRRGGAHMASSFSESVGDIAERLLRGITAAAVTAGTAKVAQLLDAVGGYGGTRSPSRTTTTATFPEQERTVPGRRW